jgi:hypothetical protein
VFECHKHNVSNFTLFRCCFQSNFFRFLSCINNYADYVIFGKNTNIIKKNIKDLLEANGGGGGWSICKHRENQVYDCVSPSEYRLKSSFTDC